MTKTKKTKKTNKKGNTIFNNIISSIFNNNNNNNINNNINKFKKWNACGSKHCNHISTPENISKLQKKHFNEGIKKCKSEKSRSKKQLCMKKHNKNSKHLVLYDKRNKCVTKNCGDL